MRNNGKLDNRFRTGVETLERRVLMDGDVSASFDGGVLVITGDDGDNLVRITQPSAGTIRVAGLDDESTINGEEAVEFDGTLGDVRIDTRPGGGEDVVQIQGAIRIGGDVVARLGEGELVIEGTTGAVDIAGDLIVRPGSAGDVSIRNDVTVHGDTRVKTAGSAGVASTQGILPDIGTATFGDPLNIDNPFFPLVPGTTYVYEQRSVDEDTGEEVVETVTTEVTSDTRTIMGIEVRVVHDQETIDGLLIEDTFDWYAQDDNGNVWYFGEDTTEFEYDDEGNQIGSSTEGSFEAGMGGARAGIVMLANPQVGDAYFQEVFVGEAIDNGEVLATGETLTNDLGTFGDVLRTKDTTAAEPDTLENKLYAPGLGLLQEMSFDVLTGEEEDVVRLVSVTQGGQDVTQVVPPDGFGGTNVTEGPGPGRVRFLGEASFAADGPVVVKDADFTGDALFFSRTDAVALSSMFADDLTVLSLGSSGLTEVTAEDDTYVRSFEDTYILDSEFSEFLTLGFSNQDNELEIEDSTFARVLADGGRGEDTFEDGGGNTFGDLRLRRFEEQIADDEEDDEENEEDAEGDD